MTSCIQLRRTVAALLVTLLVPFAASAHRSASGSSIANDRIFEAISLREGMTVCEIGAGDGELAIAAARIAGPTGRVYASELGENRVKSLQDKVTASGVTQITVELLLQTSAAAARRIFTRKSPAGL